MRIERLRTYRFRNLGPLELAIHAPVVLLRGHNGQGKTNLLEALYLCATGRSFRHATPRELINHEATEAAIHANFTHHAVRHTVTVQLAPGRRTIRVDDRGLRRVSQLLTMLNVVAFFPDDLRIAKGSPEDRRRFLDRSVANGRPEFVDASVAYHRALRSRNALLRSPKSPDRGLVAVYDEQLVSHGAVVHRCRQAGLAAMLPHAERRFRTIMGDELGLHALLHSGLCGEQQDDFEGSFRLELARSYPRDRAAGATRVGPHRADLLLTVGNASARLFASQGQQRALVLALKLAEVDALTARLGSPPILILDDVSSELDSERTRVLFDAVAGNAGQTWVSTTGAATLPLLPDAQVLRVQAGAVEAER